MYKYNFFKQTIKESEEYMKTTGIIRRIDELGRIVIPKEIRKSLRIKEGESLEILINNEDIILKKYSMIKNLNNFAQDIADAIHSFIKHSVLITDNDNILAVSGSLKKELLNKPIGSDLEIKINRREEILEKHKKPIKITQDEMECTYVATPIITNGDVIGLVMILSKDDIVDEVDLKLVQIASKFLSNHLEQV